MRCGNITQTLAYRCKMKKTYCFVSGEVLLEEEVENVIDDAFAAPRTLPKATGLTLIKKQFIGLLLKRFSHAKRNRKGFLSQIILPALFVCLAMVSSILRPPSWSTSVVKTHYN